MRSDNYVLTPDYQVRANPERTLPRLVVDLDPAHFGFVDQLDARFPHGVPSLLHCSRLRVAGDVRFGRDVVLSGDVEIRNDGPDPLQVPDGARLTGLWTG